MLKRFSVKNYKNFKEELILDFSDFKDYKYNEFAIQNNLIHTAVIYGQNASGKSNLGLALFDLTLHLIDKEQFDPQHFHYLNADSDEEEAQFHYHFLIDNQNIRYSYRKSSSTKLTYEEFYLNDEKIYSYNFVRNKGDFVRMDLIEATTLNVQSKVMNISVLRYIANNANLSKTTLVAKLMQFIGNMLWFRSLGMNHYIGYIKGGEIITANIIRNGKIDDFQEFLTSVGIHMKLEIAKDGFGQEIIATRFKQRLLPFWEIASSGTQALTLHYYWSQKFSEVSFLFVDEFDAFYHSDLAEKILLQTTKSRFQSVFTTHNTSLMTNNILRPDCYFILTNGKLNPLTKCTEKELREGHNLEKMYRNREFKTD